MAAGCPTKATLTNTSQVEIDITISIHTFNNVPNEPVHEISNNFVRATSKGSDQPAHTRSLIRAFASR